VAYWKFDETTGTTLTDYSGNDNDGTLQGTSLPIWTNGLYNGALQFNGSSSNVKVPHSDSLYFDDELTISGWFYPNKLTEQVIICKDKDGGIKDFDVCIRNGKVCIYYESTGSDQWIHSNYVVKLNTWTHFVIVFDSLSAGRMYINGVLDCTWDTTGIQNRAVTTEPIYIGMRGTTYLSHHFEGLIDELVLFNRALTEDEASILVQGPHALVKTVKSYKTDMLGETDKLPVNSIKTYKSDITATEDFTPIKKPKSVQIDKYGTKDYSPIKKSKHTFNELRDLTDKVIKKPKKTLNDILWYKPTNQNTNNGLVLYLPLNEGNNTTLYDYSSYGRTGFTSGTWVNDAKLILHLDEGIGTIVYDSSNNTNENTTNAVWVDGIYGKALQFNGTDTVIYIDDNVNRYDEQTVILWVKPDNQIFTEPHGLHKDIIRKGDEWGISTDTNFNTNRRIVVQTKYINGVSKWFSPIKPLLMDEWNFICATWNSKIGLLTVRINDNSTEQFIIGTTGINFTDSGILKLGHGCAGYFNGVIDEVKIFSRILSSYEIDNLYVQGAEYNGLTLYHDYNGMDNASSIILNPNPFTEDALTYVAWVKFKSTDNIYASSYFAINYDGDTGDEINTDKGLSRRARVGIDEVGYIVDNITLPTGFSGNFGLTIDSQINDNSAVGRAWTLEVYENDVLWKTFYVNCNTFINNVWRWSESTYWIADPTKTYTVKIKWEGNTDVIIRVTSILSRRGSIGYNNCHLRLEKSNATRINAGLYSQKRDGTWSHTVFNKTLPILDDQWHMIAVSFGNGEKKLYLDGVYLTEETGCGDLISPSSITFYLSSIWGRMYGGLKNVMAFNRKLSDGEISSLYANEIGLFKNVTNVTSEILNLKHNSYTYPDSCVAAYHFDENNGNIAYNDVDSSSNNCTLTNPTWTEGKFNSCITSMEGKYGLIDDGNGKLSPVTEMSISVWVNPSSLGQTATGSHMIVSKLNWDGSIGYFLRMGSGTGTAPTFYVGDGTIWRSVSSSSGLSTNTWYHIVATVKSNGNIRVYVNGVLKGSNQYLGDHIEHTDGNIHLGWEGYGSTFFNGLIDELQFYDRELSPEEILTLYNAQYDNIPLTKNIKSHKVELSEIKDIIIKKTKSYKEDFVGTKDFVVKQSKKLSRDIIGAKDNILNKAKSIRPIEKLEQADTSIFTRAFHKTVHELYGLIEDDIVKHIKSFKPEKFGLFDTAISKARGFHKTVEELIGFKDKSTKKTKTYKETDLFGTKDLINKKPKKLLRDISSSIDNLVKKIKDVNIEPVGLSDAQYSPVMEGCVSRWHFDENTGVTVFDDVGNNNGTLVGDPLPTWSDGVIGNCLTFNGNQHVDCGNDTSLTLPDGITISAWIKIEAVGGIYTVIAKSGEVYSQTEYWIDIRDNNNSIYFGGYDVNGNNAYISRTYAFQTGLWYHIIALDDLNNLKLYVNGIQIGSATRHTRMSNSKWHTTIGSRNNVQKFVGNIDEVQVYNRGLTPAEITYLHNIQCVATKSVKFNQSDKTGLLERSAKNIKSNVIDKIGLVETFSHKLFFSVKVIINEIMGYVDSSNKSIYAIKEDLVGFKDNVNKSTKLLYNEIIGNIDKIVKKPKSVQIDKYGNIEGTLKKNVKSYKIELSGLKDRINKNIKTHIDESQLQIDIVHKNVKSIITELNDYVVKFSRKMKFIRKETVEFKDSTKKFVTFVPIEILSIKDDIIKNVKSYKTDIYGLKDRVNKQVKTFSFEKFANTDFTPTKTIKSVIPEKLAYTDNVIKTVKSIKINNIGLKDVSQKTILTFRIEMNGHVDKTLKSISINIKDTNGYVDKIIKKTKSVVPVEATEFIGYVKKSAVKISIEVKEWFDELPIRKDIKLYKNETLNIKDVTNKHIKHTLQDMYTIKDNVIKNIKSVSINKIGMSEIIRKSTSKVTFEIVNIKDSIAKNIKLIKVEPLGYGVLINVLRRRNIYIEGAMFSTLALNGKKLYANLVGKRLANKSLIGRKEEED